MTSRGDSDTEMSGEGGGKDSGPLVRYPGAAKQPGAIVMNDADLPVVVLNVRRGHEIKKCVGRLRYETGVPYAIEVQAISDGTPISPATIQLSEEKLRRVHDEEQGIDLYYHRDFVAPDR